MTTLFLIACTPKLPSATLTVDGHAVQVEIAATPKTREKGLMHRESMERDEGMLFIYPDSAVRGFWMKNTPLPLTIAYANSQAKIVHIADMEPFDLKRISSLSPAKYALEMNQGWFDDNKVSKGVIIEGIPSDLTVE
ncbi:MAG: DUF192 domain-containing protein [Myxococcales bacterium]|nr:DUF192 domain-containing protein [Myxococcales bacterium]